MGSVVTARSLRLRLNTYSSSIQPGRNRSSAGPSCQVLAHFGCGAWRLRNIHAGFPPTIHSRGRWLRDLGGSRSSGRGTCRRGGSSRAWPLSRKSGEKGKVTPDASAAIQNVRLPSSQAKRPPLIPGRVLPREETVVVWESDCGSTVPSPAQGSSSALRLGLHGVRGHFKSQVVFADDPVSCSRSKLVPFLSMK